MHTPIIISSMLALLLAVSSGAWAQNTTAPVQAQKQEQIYGSQLMTQQERNEYQAKMRATKTAQEREQLRLEHHKQMQVRAKERGVSLPDEPPMHGKGMGPGAGKCGGPGGGMGSGGGMGPGGGGKGR
jgi:hypothetical protein